MRLIFECEKQSKLQIIFAATTELIIFVQQDFSNEWLMINWMQNLVEALQQTWQYLEILAVMW